MTCNLTCTFYNARVLFGGQHYVLANREAIQVNDALKLDSKPKENISNHTNFLVVKPGTLQLIA